MKRWIAGPRALHHGLLALLCLAALSAGAAGAEIFPYPTEHFVLDNGLKVYLIEAGAPDQLAFVTMVRTGARDEVEEGRTGFAHFFEHMMFRGTAKYPNYDAVTERMGAARNAFTSNDMTVYYVVAASDYLEEIVDLEADRFQNLSYSEAAFRTEAGAVLGEYQNNAYSPFAVLDRTIRETVFLEHTYRHQTIGFEADVRAMPEGYEYSRTFYERFYRPENAIVVVVGDFDFERAEAEIRERYSGWAPGYEAPEVPAEPAQTAPRSRTVEYEGRTLPWLSIHFRTPAWSATESTPVALEVLGNLAFGPDSEIYEKLVIEEQRLQFLSADFSLDRDPELASVVAMVKDPNDVAAVRDELLAVVEEMRGEPVAPEYLARTKRFMRYSFLMGLETAQDTAFSLIPFLINAGTLDALEQYYATLESLTPAEIQEAAGATLVDTARTEVVLVQKEAP